MKKIINVLSTLMLVVASLLSPVPHILSAEENEAEGEIGPVAISDEGQPVSDDEESPVIETVEYSSSASNSFLISSRIGYTPFLIVTNIIFTIISVVK